MDFGNVEVSCGGSRCAQVVAGDDSEVRGVYIYIYIYVYIYIYIYIYIPWWGSWWVKRGSRVPKSTPTVKPKEDEVKQAGDKILESQMVRTFAYSASAPCSRLARCDAAAASGVHKGRFSKGGFSNLCVIII